MIAFWPSMGEVGNQMGIIHSVIRSGPKIMNYRDIITIEPGKRGGKPCVRRMRITVYDVLGWLASGMSYAEILDDFPELTETDILACLAFVADRDRCLTSMAGAR